MHPAITHELTRALLADRERESRDATLAALAGNRRARPTGRAFPPRRRTPSRRLVELVTRRRSAGGAPASAR